MKRIFLIIIVCILGFNMSFAEEEASVIGKTLDKTFSPFDALLTPSQRLDPIVVTPTRYEDPSLNVSKSVTVITREEIQKSQARYIPDILKKEAGILVSDFLGNGKTVRVDMRGFGDSAASNVLVLVDGRRTNQVDLSGADWTQIDVDAIERIEIAHGPQTVMYGDNATGGVINIVTKTGKNAKPSIGVKYEVGSFRYTSLKANIEGSSDFLDYFGMISSTNNNGYRINNHFETVDYSSKLTFKPTDNFKIGFSSGYHKDWYGLPGAVKPVDINAIGREGSINPNDRAKTDDYYFMLTPEATYKLGFLETFFSTDILYRARRTNMSMPTWDVAHSDHIKNFGVTPKVAFTTNFFGVENRLLAGADYYGSKVEINDGWLASMDTILINKDTLGLYVTDTVSLPFSLILNGGFRSEWAYYKFDQEAQLVGKNEKKPFEHAYDVGLTYKYNDRSSIYATHSRSFRFPVTDEWYQSMYTDWLTGRIAGGLNLDLKPQVAYNYEIGIKENSSKYIGFKADYYVMDIKNELYYDAVTYQNSVYPHTIHHGLEVETNFYILDSIRTFANYTYAKAFFVGGSYAGNDIPLVPRNKFSAGLDYTFMDCLNILYVASYVGQRRFINDLQNSMPRLKPYVTHDVKVAYRKYGLEIFGAINNITNEEYSEYGVLDRALTNPGYYPSPKRNFTVGVSYKF